MAPRLKVFVTSDGLTDFVVATTSKVKALEAWGVRQDLFKEGQARETDDPAVVAEATARPGEVLRRPAAGSAELAKLKSAPRKPPRPKDEPPKRDKPAAPTAQLIKFEPPPKPKGPSKAALKLVADLEARLKALDTTHAKQQARLERDRAELERRAAALEAEHAKERQQLQAALSAARQALE